ncbi:Dual specificity phosphatase, catalytic domain protein [Kalmanozyma brasiliensis GHG001]|nr:Dual specificity phosphatase, catalytic domain protein [Kalmanozyma brasiliensis GHG001]EST05822.2 Dual specificity phosphatase, catalytic domain protein [Kalmanozyma brasiliensis GHG001]
MAAGAAGPPVDDLISRTVSIDPFWPSSTGSQYNDSTNSPSAYLSVALPSPSAGSTLSQTLASASSHWDQLISDTCKPSQAEAIFFLRSDADSLPIASTLNAASARNDEHAGSSSHTNVDSPHTTAMIFSSPPQIKDGREAASARPARSGRPTLTRLNTSEMLRSQTTNATQPAPIRPSPNRRSPTALKLQLDTSVPRRSATLSSYSHAIKSDHTSRLQPPLSSNSSSSPVRVMAGSSTANPSECATSAASGVTANAESYAPFKFEVSTILPDFLYLGPDIQAERNVAQLQSMGIRRILNVACECEEAGSLGLKDRFERYLKIPMMDNVEAKGVQNSIEQACTFLDDARLRCEPVYVHCKAGKSRSVTIVIAYLIHALGWTLKRSYSHVTERRAAICPNIGFVAELMRFEEIKLGIARSTGIHGDSDDSIPTSDSTLPTWTSSKSSELNGVDAAASMSTPVLTRQEPRRDRDSSVSSKPGVTLSQSSPDLPSLTFGSTS